ncbi:MAG: DUF4249 family protein [Flavobacteriales bacterium]|jgi:hypothetical protein|nr:DUF4249 family protein [Flavobacteriales bacterium]
MSIRPVLLFACATALLLNSCSTDLDVAAPYKENTVVYALLDKGTTIQFVKINKAFLGPGNALVYASVADSSEYTDEQLQAEVQEIKNGAVVNTYLLQDTLLDHDPGIFAGPQHKLYYFNAVLDSTATYRLNATAKGNTVFAETNIVARVQPTGSIVPLPLRLVSTGGGSYVSQIIRWNSSVNGKRYDLAYRFNWDEVIGADTIPKSFTQQLGTVVAANTAGNEALELPFSGESFFQSVGTRVGTTPGVSKRIFRGVDILWAVAGQDLHVYLQLNSPISGLVEDRPVYSNIDNGYGLFSSRRFYELNNKQLDATTVVELVEGQYTAGMLWCIGIPGSDYGC